MRDLYLNTIVDLTDPHCEFVEELDREIRKYGALVYNHEYNSYQFIRHFSSIDYKKELLPDFMRVEDAGDLLKGLTLTIHYEFDPETEEDEENLDIWQELSQIDLPVFEYDDDGEIKVDHFIKLRPTESKHTIWFLKTDSYDYLQDLDLLLIDPIIKQLPIAQKLVREYSLHPFDADYDSDDLDEWEEPDMSSVTRKRED
ncbi:MAG: hypothetical protein IJI05_04760 [Erysipelotrichaceae bacterium]|nr:hypothetical protein [Erysipelotrichaceae bacterium]